VSNFQPFEYMAWSKAVAPGARYAMHVSGLPPPEPLPIAMPDWDTWTARWEPLRTQLVEALGVWLGAPGRDGVIVAGDSEAIFVSLAGLVERGQPVVVERPAYAATERCVQMLGGVPVHVERMEADGWQLDPARLDACLAESSARLVAITDPHNPTGVSLEADTRAALIEVVERRRAVLIVDEVFAPFRGSQKPPAWTASSDSVLTLGSLTKAWGLSALRTGWVLGAPALVSRSRQVFDLLGVNPPTATLALALAALEHAPALDERAHRASCCVNDVIAATDWGESAIVPPHDGIIGYLRLPAARTSEEAVAALRALDGVQAVPGHFFGHDTHVRIGWDPATTAGAEGCRLISARVNGETG
jgi:aspartate/methionine/tyrosine aminotransferase